VSNLQSTELVLEGKKVIILGTKNDRQQEVPFLILQGRLELIFCLNVLSG